MIAVVASGGVMYTRIISGYLRLSLNASSKDISRITFFPHSISEYIGAFNVP